MLVCAATCSDTGALFGSEDLCPDTSKGDECICKADAIDGTPCGAAGAAPGGDGTFYEQCVSDHWCAGDGGECSHARGGGAGTSGSSRLP